MKSMTCRQMGGPCDTAITGNTAEEMMANGAAHIHSMTDDGHKKAVEMMDAAAKDPAMNKQWMDKFSTDFAALPEM